MKILIFNWRDITHQQAGGAERYIHEIGRRLAKKHDVTIWCGKYKGCKEVEEIDGIRVVRGGSGIRIGVFDPMIYLLAGWDYLSKLRKKRFDVVIECIIGLPFFTPFFAEARKIAIVHHLTGRIVFKEIPWPAAVISYLFERAIPSIYRNVRFVTVSESSRKEMMNLGISPNKIHIVYNGVDGALSPIGRKSDHPSVIYFGRIKKYKRLDLLIRAMKIVVEEVPGAKLIIAGSVEDRELRGLVGELGLEGSVTFRGHVEESDKAELLGSSWVFVTPSSIEGWGITVLEANACGTPCVAYDVPGLRDSVRDGETGLLVKKNGDVEALAGAIVEVLMNKELRKDLSERALEWARNFSWDRSAEEFTRVIENAIGTLT